MKTIYDFKVKKPNGDLQSLEDFRGKPLLIVNTASQCGFTPQYDGLEAIHKKFQDRGLRVLGFPCNQFGQQEPGTDSEIAEFCRVNHGVSFPLFSKIEVNGPGADPLYQFLTNEARGLLGTRKIKWNFTKFLVSSDGKIIRRYGSIVKPEKLESEIEKLLK